MDTDPEDNGDFNRRLVSLKQRTGLTPEEEEPADASGMRVGVELVSAVCVGATIGYFLDQYFGTIPLFLIICFFLGVGAAILNIYRLATSSKRDKR